MLARFNCLRPRASRRSRLFSNADWEPWTHTGGRVVSIDRRGRYFDLQVVSPYVASNSVGRPCQAYMEYLPQYNRMCEAPCVDSYQLSYTGALITAPHRNRPNILRIPMERRDPLLRENQYILVRHNVYGNDAIAAYHIEARHQKIVQHDAQTADCDFLELCFPWNIHATSSRNGDFLCWMPRRHSSAHNYFPFARSLAVRFC
jgi:hypothetical protein